MRDAGRYTHRVTYPDEQGHPEPPLAGDETATLPGSLERQRATLAWKCGGLDAAGLWATVGASPVTLGGLLKHRRPHPGVGRRAHRRGPARADGGAGSRPRWLPRASSPVPHRPHLRE